VVLAALVSEQPRHNAGLDRLPGDGVTVEVRDADQQVLQESLLLCLVAGILGSVLGVVLLWGITKLPYVGSFMQMAWDVPSTARAIALSLLVGLFAGLYPAWRASRLRPVEALRYE
jgi:putative ABC transport system permease protein